MEFLSLLNDWVHFEATCLGCLDSDIYSMIIISMIGASFLCLGMWRSSAR